MAQVRRRVKHTLTFEERLADYARRLRQEAENLPIGSESRDHVLRQAKQAEAASRLDKWLRPAGPALRSEKGAQSTRCG